MIFWSDKPMSVKGIQSLETIIISCVDDLSNLLRLWYNDGKNYDKKMFSMEPTSVLTEELKFNQIKLKIKKIEIKN